MRNADRVAAEWRRGQWSEGERGEALSQQRENPLAHEFAPDLKDASSDRWQGQRNVLYSSSALPSDPQHVLRAVFEMQSAALLDVMCGYLCSLCGLQGVAAYEAAREMMSEWYEEALRSATRFDTVRPPLPWLFKIGYFLALRKLHEGNSCGAIFRLIPKRMNPTLVSAFSAPKRNVASHFAPKLSLNGRVRNSCGTASGASRS